MGTRISERMLSSGKTKEAGSTPTIVQLWSSKIAVFPTMSGAALNLRRHKEWLRITALGRDDPSQQGTSGQAQV